MYNLLIKNASVPVSLLGGSDSAETARTDIFIENGAIGQVGPDLPRNQADVLDARGRYVLPGLIDMDCRCCDPGYENREDFVSVSKSAAKGGFTGIACMPDTLPVIDNKTVVHYVLHKSRRESLVQVYPYGSVSRDCAGEHLAEIGEMIKAGVAAVTNAGSPIDDAALLRNALRYMRMFDVPLITVCHDAGLAAGGVMNQGVTANKLGLAGIPREAEETIAARNIILARYAKTRLHIAPVSTRGTVELIRRAKADGDPVTCGTCAHFFTLTEESADGYNTLAKTLPPLRTRDDAEALIEGLLDGTIDVIASGHAPDAVENVMVEFDRASCALSALETAFPAAYTALTASGRMPLAALVGRMSAAPARILSLANKGRIAAGADADLFILDTERPHTVDAAGFASKAKYSPYQGAEMACTVVSAIVNGRIVFLHDA